MLAGCAWSSDHDVRGPLAAIGLAFRTEPRRVFDPLAHVLGWQDATHVVVGRYRTWVHVVDVETGEAQRIDLAGSGQQVNAPLLANALWRQPLRIPVEPIGTADPRGPWRWAALVLLAGAGAIGVRRRRS